MLDHHGAGARQERVQDGDRLRRAGERPRHREAECTFPGQVAVKYTAELPTSGTKIREPSTLNQDCLLAARCFQPPYPALVDCRRSGGTAQGGAELHSRGVAGQVDAQQPGDEDAQRDREQRAAAVFLELLFQHLIRRGRPAEVDDSDRF